MKTSDKWVKCVTAGSDYYTVGQVYQVYNEGGKSYVLGSDGLYDSIGSMVSKFVPHKEPSDENP